MLLTAELLLQYQRCKRRAFLDTYGDRARRDAPDDLLLKLQQDKSAHQKNVLSHYIYQQPDYPKGNWNLGAEATWELMQHGVDCIYKGVLLASSAEKITLLSRPDLLIKQPGKSCFGDWIYVTAQIELGKRPKLEYQIIAAFHAQILAAIQQSEPETAWLLLRRKQAYGVNLVRLIPQMQQQLQECIQALESPQAPEVFISRQRCSLCGWFSQCYEIAKSQQHLSLLPGVTPNRYTQLQTLNLVTVESLAHANSSELELLTGFDAKVTQQLILQAQSVAQNRPLLLANDGQIAEVNVNWADTDGFELYFDIEAQPDLNLDYMLGVLVVNSQLKTEKFYAFVAEQPEDEALIWQQFIELVEQYPLAPVFHFCSYEVETVKRLARLYNTPRSQVQLLLTRFVDVYEQITKQMVLPIESYALKSIARWLNFEWRDPKASGSQCIYWYEQWLATGDRTFLDAIVQYNEDDCRATRHVKDWLGKLSSIDT